MTRYGSGLETSHTKLGLVVVIVVVAVSPDGGLTAADRVDVAGVALGVTTLVVVTCGVVVSCVEELGVEVVSIEVTGWVGDGEGRTLGGCGVVGGNVGCGLDDDDTPSVDVGVIDIAGWSTVDRKPNVDSHLPVDVGARVKLGGTKVVSEDIEV